MARQWTGMPRARRKHCVVVSLLAQTETTALSKVSERSTVQPQVRQRLVQPAAVPTRPLPLLPLAWRARGGHIKLHHRRQSRAQPVEHRRRGSGMGRRGLPRGRSPDG